MRVSALTMLRNARVQGMNGACYPMARPDAVVKRHDRFRTVLQAGRKREQDDLTPMAKPLVIQLRRRLASAELTVS